MFSFLYAMWAWKVILVSNAACSTQLIDGDGVFNVSGVDHFFKEVKLEECGLSYAVVSIMGPQSSGKSTLLNHLFGTNFREMDAFRGRHFLKHNDFGDDRFKRSDCGSGYGSLRMRVVAVTSGFKRFVRLVMWFEIGAIAGYL
ncbi:unnamed protein product [Brassica oleracea]